MHQLMSTGLDEDISTSVLSLLVYGWGNSNWSADPAYLRACIRAARNKQGAILECGSGLSTVVLGCATSGTGRSVYALEHKTEWAHRVRSCLAKYELEHVKVMHSPLHNHGSFCWYNPPHEEISSSFSTVVCDGPPGDTKGGRFGLIPVMKDRLSEDAVVLLDDLDRPGEQKILHKWDSEVDIDYSIEEEGGKFAKIYIY
jgi:predicted O-methyltransferase YrrM